MKLVVLTAIALFSFSAFSSEICLLNARTATMTCADQVKHYAVSAKGNTARKVAFLNAVLEDLPNMDIMSETIDTNGNHFYTIKTEK